MGIFSKEPSSYNGALYPDKSRTNYVPDYREDLTATSKIMFDVARIIPTSLENLSLSQVTRIILRIA